MICLPQRINLYTSASGVEKYIQERKLAGEDISQFKGYLLPKSTNAPTWYFVSQLGLIISTAKGR